jgi:exopolysaccharide biosynthesis polyprenyl glycosylphosphotransferase
MTDTDTLKIRKPWQLRLGERKVLLVFGDFIMALLALVISLYWWDQRMRFIDLNLDFMQKQGYLWFYFLPIIWLLLLFDLYDFKKAISWQKTIRSIFFAGLLGLALYAIIYVYQVGSPETLLPRLGVVIFLASACVLTLLWRLFFIRLFTSTEFLRRFLLVGGGRSGQELLKVIQSIHPAPFIVEGIIDDDPQKREMAIQNVSVIGTCHDLIQIIRDKKITDIVVAITSQMQGGMFEALLEAQERGVTISRMPVVYEELAGRVPIQLLETDWILRSFVDKARLSGFSEIIKRLMDIAGGFVGSLIFVVLIPFIGLAIVLDDGWPVFYSQVRSGQGAQPYKIIKFRTMRRDAEADGRPKWAKEDDERATRVGKFLRKTHLDELPQFWNVLRGDMSLVGPRAERPELVDYFQQYVPFYRARLLVRPGITGWAQVNYGYASTVEETTLKLEYDLYYILNRSIILDLLIILRTPTTMFGFHGR